MMAAVFVVVIAILKEVQSRSSLMVRTYVSEKLVLGFRLRFLGHIQRLSVMYHDTAGTADSTYPDDVGRELNQLDRYRQPNPNHHCSHHNGCDAFGDFRA